MAVGRGVVHHPIDEEETFVHGGFVGL